MQMWGQRLIAAFVLACGLSFGADAWAQACSTLNGTSVSLPAGTSTRASGVVTQTPGDSVTTTITGAVGASGTISFGNGSVPFSGPGSYTVTNTASSPSTQVIIQTTTGGTAGTASFQCGGSTTGGSGGGGGGGDPGVQNANRAQVAVQISIETTRIHGNAISTAVTSALRPRTGGPKPCPVCDQLRQQISALQRKIGDDDATIAEINTMLKGAGGRADAGIVLQEMGRIEDLKADIKQLDAQITQLEDDLSAAQAAANEGASLPYSEWRKPEIEQSLMPRQSLRSTIRDQLPADMLAFDDAPKRSGPTSFSLGRDELIQLAQRPDGSNSLREALSGQWNIWTEGRFTGATDSLANTASIGFVGTLGADYRFRPWLTAGLSLGFETAQTKTSAPGGGIGAFGITALPYVGVRLDPHVFVSFFAGVTGLSYNATPGTGITAAYGGTRLFTGGSLTGVWQDGPWRLQPGVSFTYGSEAQTSYTDSAGTFVSGQTVQFGRASAGPEVGYTFRDPAGAWSVEPYLRGQFNLDFATDERVFLNGLVISTRSGGSGTVAGGVQWQTGARFNGKLEASYDSIGVTGLDLWSALFHFNWSF
jgi:Autotransporter beta-domain